MRRQPLVLQAFLALVVFCLIATVPGGGTRSEPAATFGSVHGETAVVSSPHATIGRVATSRKASPSDWSSRLFLPSRGIPAPDGGASVPSAFAFSGIRDGGSPTITYDATAPPPPSRS